MGADHTAFAEGRKFAAVMEIAAIALSVLRF
jgi:hypothetical protein